MSSNVSPRAFVVRCSDEPDAIRKEAIKALKTMNLNIEDFDIRIDSSSNILVVPLAKKNKCPIPKRIDDIITEDPEEEALALKNAWERAGPKKIQGSEEKWEEEPSYLLQSGVRGLFKYQDSGVWVPKKNEEGSEASDWSETGSCVSTDTAYESCLSDSGTSAYDSPTQSPLVIRQI